MSKVYLLITIGIISLCIGVGAICYFIGFNQGLNECAKIILANDVLK